ncbi:hypothetical protein JWJ90_07295 [Desulfobulbus rhabdoformis]|uniref:hypothetical protein n=1 Tax=Desulfobulbus rhabdoformis TaxID=34032 RepID=UPI0019634B63|nr:hypothetical protein [Desulfobulbus rhabdoformis]MBM9614090.1 hypothetical protein [Desulfobulbus rhabdoformis]
MVAQTNLDLIDGYLQQLDWRVQENSNMSYSLQGLNNYILSELSRTYWLKKIHSAEVPPGPYPRRSPLHDLNLLSVYSGRRAMPG